jgi:hypothetical protein
MDLHANAALSWSGRRKLARLLEERREREDTEEVPALTAA